MRGVVLAGGTGSRLAPLSEVTNKHLLPVGREPMIFHPIKKLVAAGVSDILVVTGTEHAGAIFQLLGSGERFGCRLTFRVQSRPAGIADAIGLAEGFASGGPIAVLLGDNVFEADLGPLVERFPGAGCQIALKQVDAPERFGVAVLDSDGRVERIVEKPQKPVGNLAVVGIYVFDATVYGIVRRLVPSSRGELEIVDILDVYRKRDELDYVMLTGWWTDAGTHESFALANKLVGQLTEE